MTFGAGLSLASLPNPGSLGRIVAVAVALAGATTIVMVSFSLGDPLQPDGSGDWAGVFSHKNSLGHFMALGFMNAICLLGSSQEQSQFFRKLAVIQLLTTPVLTAFSGSATSLILIFITLAVVAFALTMTASRHKVAIALFTFSLILLTAEMIWIFSSQLFQFLGRDPTFTGRTDIWAFALEFIAKRPILGYGYAYFWSGWTSPGAVFWRSVPKPEIHSHNGYLEVVLALGLVGLLPFIVALARSLYLCGQFLFNGANAARFYLWDFTYLIFYVTINLDENYAIDATSLYFCLFVAVSGRLRAATEPRARHFEISGGKAPEEIVGRKGYAERRL
jgi:O-antigen ligase